MTMDWEDAFNAAELPEEPGGSLRRIEANIARLEAELADVSPELGLSFEAAPRDVTWHAVDDRVAAAQEAVARMREQLRSSGL